MSLKTSAMTAALVLASLCEVADDVHDGLPLDEVIERAGRTTRMRREAIRKASIESRGKRRAKR